MMFTNWKKKYKRAQEVHEEELSELRTQNTRYWSELERLRQYLREATAHDPAMCFAKSAEQRRWSAAWKRAAKKWFDRGEIAEGLNILLEIKIEHLMSCNYGWRDSTMDARAWARRLLADKRRLDRYARNLEESCYYLATKVARLETERDELQVGAEHLSDIAMKHWDSLGDARERIAELEAQTSWEYVGNCRKCGQPNKDHECSTDSEFNYIFCPAQETITQEARQ